MFKILFELLTSPLGLPIPAYWEYILLALIEGLAFRIAWKVSPGGFMGSAIHWTVRLFMFIVFWGCAYMLVTIVKWIIQNWIIVLIAVVSLLMIVRITTFLIERSKKFV